MKESNDQNPEVIPPTSILAKIGAILPGAVDMSNVKPIADLVTPIMNSFEKHAQRAAELGKQIDEYIASNGLERCEDHPDTELPVNKDKTFSEAWFSGKFTIVYDQCPDCLRERERILVNERLRRIGIPDKVLHATFANFKLENEAQEIALEKAKRQAKRNRGFLIMRGTPGTGKSHLAAAILKEKGGIFETLQDLIGKLRNTYENGGQEELVSRYRECPCFVLDELDKNVKGTDVQNVLLRILAHRYDKDMLTIITSNDLLSEIEDTLGPRLKDRMKADYKIATMEWDSHRAKRNETSGPV